MSILQNIGLNTYEIKIYKTLINEDFLSIAEIVQKTSIHRPTVYKSLEHMTKLHIVQTTPHGKGKRYLANSPEQLEKIFRNIEDDFNSEIFELNEIYKNKNTKPKIIYDQGDKAIYNIYLDVVTELEKGDTYYRYSPKKTEAKDKYLPKAYKYLRDKKELNRLIITDEASFNRSHKKLGKGMKAVPNSLNLFKEDVNQIIYGDKFSIIDFNTKSTITIQNKMIVDFQKRIFKCLYDKL